MLQRGRGNTELIGQLHSQLCAQGLKNCVVVGGVPNTKRDFTSQSGTYFFWTIFAIANAIGCSAFALQYANRQIAKSVNQIARR